MTLLELPSELLISVLRHLDGPTLARISQVNRFFHTVVTTSSILTYLQHLHVHKLQDNAACSHLSTSEKLALLKKQQSAWTHCKPDFELSAPITFRPGSVYDLSDGIYLLGEHGKQVLRYMQLPRTPADKIVWKAFKPVVEEPTDVRIKTIVDFAINIHEHDLIALITSMRYRGGRMSKYELSLYQLSTGKPHPLAKQPVLEVMREESQLGAPVVNCEIVGDYLALIVSFWFPIGPCEVFVWNWKTGNVLLNMEGESGSYAGIVFLSIDTILLPNVLENNLEIWRLPSLDGTQEQPTAPILTLGLFQTAMNYNVRFISCRAEPNPVPPNAILKSDAPFHPAPEDAIVLLHFRIHGMGLVSLLTVFVHRSSVLKISEEPHERDVIDSVSSIPWAEWAPRITFCHDCGGDMPSRWITTTCGQRYVLLTLDDEDLDEDMEEDDGLEKVPSKVRVLDFAPGNVRLAELRGVGDEGEDELVVRRGPHYIPTGSQKLFADDMVTYLPYVESRTKKKYMFDGALIDEERIIGIKTDIIGHITGVEVIHFG
ncbi:hypothetical protein E1B28_003046 [Marasmius oreades]|uniref:F-box domain-containing protein n=1 Tax=Marasmius oreades TaxID=181124 RepID=A0A9P7RM83_9AGAR|nr:uncharacterized protein E1B28_003046 [Marasmius oreades]KAG7085483.1 hypothetical protein E1B28_003046 [Marasmius oreades]